MNKRIFGFCILIGCLAASTFASRKDEVTLVLVPREEQAVQLGMDIANRYPTLLVSYRMAPNGNVSLNGWTGSQWVNISVEDFKMGNFFRTGPESALLVEPEGKVVPESIVPPEEWCASIYRIATIEIRPMLHLIGRYYNFKYRDWEWFSKRYDQPMGAINPEDLNVAWYHKPLKDHFKSKGFAGTTDLQYWFIVRQPPPPATAPVEVVPEEEAPPQSAEEAPDEVPSSMLTNEVDEAVILGAGDADTTNTSVSAEKVEVESDEEKSADAQ